MAPYVLMLACLLLVVTACSASPTPEPTVDIAALYEPSPILTTDTPTAIAGSYPTAPSPGTDGGTVTPAAAPMPQSNPQCANLATASPTWPSASAVTLAPVTDVSELPAQGANPLLLAPGAVEPTRTVTATVRVHLPILVYHHIQVLAANAPPIWRGLSVSPDEFEKQMAYLQSHNYHTIYFSDLVAHFREGRPLPENPIILTFDDGWVAQYTVAYPILRKHCLVGVFFPPTNWVDRTTGSVMNWAQVAEMSAGEMEFGSHTVTHSLMAQRTDAQNRYEMLASKQLVEQHTGRPVVALAYPGGSFNANVVRLLSETGYGAGVSMLGGVFQSADEIYTLRRTSIRYWDTVEMFAAKLQ
ncbi:MAG: polysaccharide deacetylase family protein [Anaerolineae bacterium]